MIRIHADVHQMALIVRRGFATMWELGNPSCAQGRPARHFPQNIKTATHKL